MDVLIDTNPAHHELETHATRIRASGILARSTHLHSLFEYLYRCHIKGKTPKELEIAIEGMGREESFDVTQDAVVRVYVHKLRRKLDEFYAQHDIDYYYASRLAGEPEEGVEDLHYHPAEPRTLRAKVEYRF